ncbi:DUF6318 family protein [bacterium RCC_150]
MLTLSLAGCSGNSGPSPSTGAASRPTSSPAPSYKPADSKGKAENVPRPVMPAEAKAHTREGLQAFMKHWVGLLSYAYETGNTDPLFEVTGGGCTSCKNMQNVVSDAYADGKWIVGAQMKFISADSAMVTNQYGQISGVVIMQQDVANFLNADGSVRSTSGGESAKPNLFLVVPRDKGWELGDIGKPESTK